MGSKKDIYAFEVVELISDPDITISENLKKYLIGLLTAGVFDRDKVELYFTGSFGQIVHEAVKHVLGDDNYSPVKLGNFISDMTRSSVSDELQNSRKISAIKETREVFRDAHPKTMSTICLKKAKDIIEYIDNYLKKQQNEN